MGRKIPGRKHKKIKDPEVQRRQRFDKIKNMVNNPPPKGKEDEQAIPKSVLEIMKLKEKAKHMQKKNTRRKNDYKKMANDPDDDRPLNRARIDMSAVLGKDKRLPGMERPDRYIPDFTQGPNEDLQALEWRIHNSAKELIKEVKYEEKFKVEIQRDEEGRLTKIKSNNPSKKLKLSEKRKNRLEKKLAGKEVDLEFPKLDRVEFGDVVHAPPTNLTLPGKKGKKEEPGRRPGKSELLLKKVLPGKTQTSLSPLDKQRQELQRQAAVDAFRQIKRSARHMKS